MYPVLTQNVLKPEKTTWAGFFANLRNRMNSLGTSVCGFCCCEQSHPGQEALVVHKSQLSDTWKLNQ